MEIWFFPYLLVFRRRNVGPWRLVPKKSIRPRDAAGPGLLKAARGVGSLYETDPDPLISTKFGAFVIRRSQTVGAVHDRGSMQALRRAVVAALLDGNPIEESPQPSGHGAWTSDNAVLFGHPVTGSGSVTVEHGAMVRTLVSGYRPGSAGSTIRPPTELHLPLLGQDLDPEYATVIYRLLVKGDDFAARLGRVIDWLDLAWRNTTSIDADLRIMALRSGFEVLLSRMDEEDPVTLAHALSHLLDPPGAKKCVRHWKRRSGKPTSQALTDLEWWFVTFTFLRNAVAHGVSVTPQAYFFDTKSHVMVAEANLRRAVKARVLARGYKWLRLDPLNRRIERAWAKLGRRLPGVQRGSLG